MSDELLVVRCGLGERDAFPELVRRWHRAVERSVRRMPAGPDDDVVQEVRLPVREREGLLLFYLGDLPLDACAQVCGVPVGAVKSRLNRARRLLRDELARKEHEV
jgi:predicted DNA-binding protein (UPF0251 family)